MISYDHFYKNTSSKFDNSKYLDQNVELITNIPANSIKISQCNIQYFHKNFNIMYKFIKALNFIPIFTCLSETPIKNNFPTNLSIPSCSLSNIEFSTSAGGVITYVSNQTTSHSIQKTIPSV